MGWTPPSKFTVILTFLLLAFGIFILIDIIYLAPDNHILLEIDLATGDFENFEVWGLIAIIILFLSWFIFYLGVKLSGL
jgi:hypothetical protein